MSFRKGNHNSGNQNNSGFQNSGNQTHQSQTQSYCVFTDNNLVATIIEYFELIVYMPDFVLLPTELIFIALSL